MKSISLKTVQGQPRPKKYAKNIENKIPVSYQQCFIIRNITTTSPEQVLNQIRMNVKACCINSRLPLPRDTLTWVNYGINPAIIIY